MLGFMKKRRTVRNRSEHPVVRFLENSPGCAFTAEIIINATKMNANTVRSMLRKLINEGRVGHLKPFFYWK